MDGDEEKIMSNNIWGNDPQEDDVEDDIFTSAGFLFDSCQASGKETFTFSPSHSANGAIDQSLSSITITLECIDDTPGALQSGHYIWPASPALAQFLVDTYRHQQHSSLVAKEDVSSIQRIMELGAGCGLVSMCAYQLFTNSTLLVVTDHDPGTLKRAKSNFESLGKEKDNRSTRVLFEELSWCDSKSYFQNFFKRIQEETKDCVQCTSCRQNDNDNDAAKFDLILGSDLIYSLDVVRPLLTTVSYLLRKSNEGSKMILSQSFNYSELTEKEIDNVCAELKMCRRVISDLKTNKDTNIEEEGAHLRVQQISFYQ